jgi:Protein of unknown function (DUF1592)/Protein of unknown function (DUF1588)/Protein of unknown function (DUF1595)/Protein of unknown function (DUF1587)/Protein of unknown function (DUF1585)
MRPDSVRSLLICVLAAPAAVMAAGPTISFTKSVYPIFEEAGCRACHNHDGVASATRLQFPEQTAPADRIEEFGKSLVVLVDAKNPEGSLLLRKPTARMSHAGGQRIQPESVEEVALRAWIARLAEMQGDELARALRYREMEAAGNGAARPRVALRKLTHSQYNHTVRDLLGDRSSPANQFPPEDFVNGFKNQYASQNLSPLLEDAYSAAAEKLAATAFRDGGPRLVACDPSPACRAEFIRTFGLRAFRRPLDANEITRYQALFQRAADFRAGAQLVVEAMLQSPNFLFRLDDAVKPEWHAYAAASSLSYALWDSMPDDALLASAARGELDTREGVERAARRMLADPKAKEAVDEFASEWLRFDRALTATKERRAFPNFTPETAIAMTQEARRFVSALVWEGMDFTQLFTAGYGFPNGDLARIYGVEPPANDFERVAFPADSGRAGILGQALFLTLTAKPDETSPTARGLFVREQFLCQHVADPPPGVNTNLPPVTAEKPMTNRERMGIHATSKACAGCHNLVDPIGFGFEKFDAIGQRREKLKLAFGQRFGENEEKKGKVTTVELDLDTAGQVVGLPNSAFASPKELGAVLAASPQCQECIVKQYFRFVSGRTETPADRPLIRAVYEDFRRSGFRFQEMIVSMMRARVFAEGGQGGVAGDH